MNGLSRQNNHVRKRFCRSRFWNMFIIMLLIHLRHKRTRQTWKINWRAGSIDGSVGMATHRGAWTEYCTERPWHSGYSVVVMVVLVVVVLVLWDGGQGRKLYRGRCHWQVSAAAPSSKAPLTLPPTYPHIVYMQNFQHRHLLKHSQVVVR